MVAAAKMSEAQDETAVKAFCEDLAVYGTLFASLPTSVHI